MIGFANRILTGVFAVLGVAGFSQFPAFFSAYVHNLAGRLAQAERGTSTLRRKAEELGIPVNDLITKIDAEMGSNLSSFLIDDSRQNMQDLGEHHQAYTALQNAEIYEKPYYFLRYFDMDIAAQVAQHYAPSFPLTLESLLYAGAGLLFGICVCILIGRIVRLPFHRKSPESQV